MISKLKNIVRGSIFYSIYKKTEAFLAVRYYGNPSKDLIVIWVTGTDGKSTTCNLIHHILNNTLGKTALVTTVNMKIGDESIPNNTKLTSLPPFKLQQFLRDAVADDCKYAVIEVSSHGIEQHRISFMDFDLGLLTNISEEHLDYHKTLDDYANTKKKLFKAVLRNTEGERLAVFNKDCNYGKAWEEEFAFNKSEVFALMSLASISGKEVKETKDGTEFNLHYLSESYPIKSKLLGFFNMYNVTAAITASKLLGVDLAEAIKVVQTFPWLDGRLEKFVDKRGVTYYVDFAHTPAALESVLRFLKKVKETGKIITVFGAPGNRDRKKRPIMGSKVELFSDYIILTDDDPDTEDRNDIINEVRWWVRRKLWDRFWIQPERELAIELAVELAEPWDLVLLAGKGHEQVQITNMGKRKYSDKETLLQLIEIQ